MRVAEIAFARGGDRFLRLLWLTLAGTFPLFAVEFLRFNNETQRIHIALPMIVLALILAVGCARFVARAVRGVDTGWRLMPSTPWERALLASLGCFVAWHVVGYARAAEWVLPSRELAKVAFGAFSVAGILTFFPREPGFLDRFWTIVFCASAVLVALLVAEYAFVFRYPYLGNQIGGVPNTYSIQLAWYLTPVMLFTSFYVGAARKKTVAFLALFVFATGWLYVSSRASWLAVGAGMSTVVPTLGFRRSLSYSGLVAAVVVAAVLFLCMFVPAHVAFPRRALFLVSPASVPELHSYEMRADLFKKSWNCFTSSPVVGIGLGATDTCVQLATHNDYMKILSDLGVVGLVLFLAVFVVVGIKVLGGAPTERNGWLSLASRASLVALFVMMCFHNLYTTTFTWVLLGLICVEADPRQDVIRSDPRETPHLLKPSGRISP